MEKREVIIIRSVFVLISLFFLYLSISSIVSQVGPMFENFTNIDSNNSFDLDLMSIIIYFILFVIFLKIGIHWSFILKSLTKSLISFAIIFLTIGFMLLAVNNKTEELVDSLQPSIDQLILSSIDEMLEEDFKSRKDDTIELILATKIETQEVCIKNLMPKDAKIFSQAFELDLSEQEEISFAKFLINSVYQQQSENKELKNLAIPINTIKTLAKDQGVDLGILDMVPDFTLLDNFYTPDENACILILLTQGEQTKTIEIGKISDNDLNLIWKNLNLDEDVSKQTKTKLVEIALSFTLTELEKQNMENIALPIASISSMIPPEAKNILNYDIFAENEETRLSILQDIRNDCSNSSSEICEGIMLTEYDNFMTNIDNLTAESGLVIPEPILTSLKNYDEISKIKTTLNKNTQIWYYFIIIYFILMGLAYISYLAHFKLFKRELIAYHVPYFISKLNLIHFILYFIFLAIVYYLFAGNIIFNFILESAPEELASTLSLAFSLPTLNLIIEIMGDILMYSMVYL
ncbi:MAG: hypothetical protein KC550_06350, partial [Nanoarchaeota archaeon]|nr:hypothetical protein [Nanoarchaeota archaeon]